MRHFSQEINERTVHSTLLFLLSVSLMTVCLPLQETEPPFLSTCFSTVESQCMLKYQAGAAWLTSLKSDKQTWWIEETERKETFQLHFLKPEEQKLHSQKPQQKYASKYPKQQHRLFLLPSFPSSTLWALGGGAPQSAAGTLTGFRMSQTAFNEHLSHGKSHIIRSLGESCRAVKPRLTADYTKQSHTHTKKLLKSFHWDVSTYLSI